MNQKKKADHYTRSFRIRDSPFRMGSFATKYSKVWHCDNRLGAEDRVVDCDGGDNLCQQSFPLLTRDISWTRIFQGNNSSQIKTMDTFDYGNMLLDVMVGVVFHEYAWRTTCATHRNDLASLTVHATHFKTKQLKYSIS